MTTQSAMSLAWKRANHAARIAASRQRCSYPAPRVPKTETSPSEPFIPNGVARVAGALVKNPAWRWRLTRASGPRINARGEVAEADCATLCIAAQGPDGRRLVWEWRFEAAKQSWKLESVQDGRTGEILDATKASRIVKGDPS